MDRPEDAGGMPEGAERRDAEGAEEMPEDAEGMLEGAAEIPMQPMRLRLRLVVAARSRRPGLIA